MSPKIMGTLTPDDVAAIRAISDNFGSKVLARDFATLVTYYTSEAVFMPPHHPAVEGRAELRKWLDAFPPASRFELGVDEIDGRGDLAYVRGTFSMTVTPEGAPGPIEDAGKYLEIRRKRRDGSWPIAVDIFNSDRE